MGILIFMITAFLLLLGGGALIRGIMSFWEDEPSYVHAYGMYIIAVVGSFPTHPYAYQDWGVLVLLVPPFFIYGIGLHLLEDRRLVNKKDWLRGALLTAVRGALLTAVRGALLAAVHVMITFPVFFMLVI